MKKYRTVLILSPSEDNHIIDGGSITNNRIRRTIFSPMVTKTQWDNCEDSEEGNMNPRYSLTGYKDSYLLSEMKRAFDAGKPLYFEANELEEIEPVSVEVAGIESKNIAYYINDAKPNIEGNLIFGDYLLDSFVTDKNGHYAGTFLIPKNIKFTNPVTVKVIFDDDSFVTKQYTSNVIKQTRRFLRVMMPVGVLVDGEFYGTRE